MRAAGEAARAADAAGQRAPAGRPSGALGGELRRRDMFTLWCCT